MNSESGSMQVNQTTSNWLPLLIMILILWLGTGLRFYQLDAQSFWNDEGNSARLSERSLDLIVEGTASDIHPPLYYFILRGWRELLGESEFGLRSFSAFTGILTVAATYSLGRLLGQGRHRRSFWAVLVVAAPAFLAAVNPALIYYSQEARMYALLAFLAAISTIFLWRWLNSKHGFRWAVAYVLAASAGLYTHYFFPAILILQNFIILIWLYRNFRALLFSPSELRQKRPFRHTIRRWLVIMIVIFIIHLPWLPVFWRQTGGRPASREPFFQFLGDSLSWLAFGETLDTSAIIWLASAVIGLLVWALVAARRQVVVPLLGTAVPVLFMFAAGTTQPAFYKFMLSAVPFFLVWVALAFSNRQVWVSRKWHLLVPALLLVAFLWGTASSLTNLYQNPAYARADYRSMARRIAEDNHPNAGIILNAPNQWEVFTYYHREGAPVYPLPKGQPNPAILIPELERIASRHDRLYVIFWGDDQRDPEHIIEGWLEEHTFKAAEEWIGDVRFVVYAVPGQAAQTMENPVQRTFGDRITLQGYALATEQLSAGDILQLTLFWETVEPLDTRYKIFIHLLDENGRLVAQRDSEPGGGLEPTTTWEVGQSVIDNHGLLLPAQLQPGEYTLIMGLYELADPSARLSLDNGGENQDNLTLGIITVE